MIRRRSRPVMVLIVAMLAGCASAGPAPPVAEVDQLIVVDGVGTCQFGGPLGRISDGLVVWDEAAGRNRAGPPIDVPGVAEPVVPRLSRLVDGYMRGRAEIRVRWRELLVTGIETRFLPESDDIAHFLTFAEPPARVLAVLGANGFRLDPATRQADVEIRTPEGAESVTLFVERRGNGSALGCVHNY